MVDAEALRRALLRPTPGFPVAEARPAAVIVPVLLAEDARVVVLVRSKDLRDHAGEAGFPGGKPEPADADLEATALRELREELGVTLPREAIVGGLMPVPVIDRRYLIHPFVAIADDASRFRVASGEVAAVYAAPLGAIVRSEVPYFAVRATWRGAEALAPHFELAEADRIDGAPGATRRVLYGASAYVLYELVVRLANALGVAVPEPVIETARPWGDRYARFER